MNNKKVTLIYILGAGRSGSTILSTILGASKSIFNCADLMQFYEYGCLEKICNDGNTIFESPFWSKVLELYDPNNALNYCEVARENHEIEYHNSFIENVCNLTSKDKVDKYIEEQEKLIKSICKVSKLNYIVDSSKYPGRALLLSRSKNIDVKFIYNIRDVRGVVYSFSKQVQTPRQPLSAIFYYFLVNMMSELAYRKLPKSKKIRIRYEDLALDTNNTLENISNFLNVNFDDVYKALERCDEINVGPIIEGNRMVKKKQVKLSYDKEWLSKIGLPKRIFYYLLSLPIMIINKYNM